MKADSLKRGVRMGLLRHRVSSLVLVCVLMLLLDNIFAIAAQDPESPYVLISASNTLECFQVEFQGDFPSGGGRCLHPEKIRFKENPTGSVFSFSTEFVAGINRGDGGYGDRYLEGFTFALLPDVNASLGGDGKYLGLLNATANGNPESHTFAVEFDFARNAEFSDPVEGFHIGVDVNSMNSTKWAFLEEPNDDPLGYFYFQVWVDYDASTQILNVSTADINWGLCFKERPGPKNLTDSYVTTGFIFNSLTVQLNLSDVLNEFMYVGFTWYISPPNYSTPFVRSPGSFSTPFWGLRTSPSTSPPLPSEPLPCIYNSYFRDPYFQIHSYGIRLATTLSSLLLLAIIYAVLYERHRRRVERRGWRFHIDPEDVGDAEPHQFTYKELALATKNFDPKLALGRGGFGSVYKGFLPGNRLYVAVKRVAPESSQGEREFLAEVAIIGKIRHRNLVRLQGWCHERGELLLVYDYMPQGSLDKHLFVSPVAARKELAEAGDEQRGVSTLVAEDAVPVGLPWERRFKVIADVAAALVYLHTECEERIIHRDVKAANVMLDAKFNARLGDFGLARSYNHSLLTPESTNVAGTLGYFAPELFHSGKQTEQTDVYSFGAFLLEVAYGKKPIYHKDGEVIMLVEHVWRLWGESRILDAATHILQAHMIHMK